MISNINHDGEVLAELRKANKLLALIATDGKPHGERILLLNQLGFSSSEIGDLLAITPNAVRLVVHKARKKKT
jgi:DNA-directed RNA polymerase specialized sigma24 family protein